MHLLIAAAGRGSRMGQGVNKVFLPLLGKPILAWTLAAVQQAKSITWIGLLHGAEDYEPCQRIIATYPGRLPVTLIPGGTTRQASVRAGLEALPQEATQVLIHDAARCLVTPALIDRCAEALFEHPGVIAALPVKDTIKAINPDTQLIDYTPPRETLWAAQTPQGFGVSQLKHAHQKALAEQWSVTDDAALFERLGLPVAVVLGEETNLKITTPLDLILAQVILQGEKQGDKSTPDLG